MSILRLRCAGNRCMPPAVVPPVWLAFVIAKLVRPASRIFSVITAGQAWLDFNPKPADKLSPSTRTRFIAEESRGAAGADCGAMADEMTSDKPAIRNCLNDLPIYIPSLTRC